MIESNNTPQQPTYIIPPPSAPNWKTPVVAGLFALLIATDVYLYTQMERMKSENKLELARLNQDVSASIDRIRIESDATVRRSRDSLDRLKSQLEEQRRAADRAVGQAKIDAEKKVQLLAQQVSTEQTKQQHAIAEVKETADSATTKIADVSTDVGSVKTEVQTQKSELEQTVANLKRVTGDVDNHASLIATNGKELSALRALGERNYFEFTVAKAKNPQKIGDIMVLLKKSGYEA